LGTSLGVFFFLTYENRKRKEILIVSLQQPQGKENQKVFLVHQEKEASFE